MSPAPRGTRTGFTTGACAAASAKAATRVLVRGTTLSEIETTLPNRQKVTFPLARCERSGARALCSIIKDAGDDPDCTNGAELIGEVELSSDPGIDLRGGAGVATVTKPGLGLEVGGPAINPVPRRNIIEMVEEELAGSEWRGALVIISVPRGEEMAKETLNARLGLMGGISILGTTGIVKPYSTAAYKASVVQAIDVATRRGLDELVLTTGGKSESYAMKLLAHLPEDAFIQVGDFIGTGIRHAARRHARRVNVVGMIGKLSKMADGKMQTHAAGSEVNLALLASLASELGASTEVAAQIAAANTARHALEVCSAAGLVGVTSLICRRVAENCAAHAAAPLEVHAYLVDFNGALLGRHPGGNRLNDMRQMTALGRQIEDSSFAIIDAEAGPHEFGAGEWQVVRRVIHATADFEFKSLIRFDAHAVRAGIAALRGGCPVIADVKMILAGLNEDRLRAYGCATHSFISDEDVIAEAKRAGSTRAIEAMRKAHRLGLLDGAVVAVGNAPTALIEAARLVEEEGARPALFIGVPVGFVSAAESKEIAMNAGVPYIVARGRKGGSTIAVAIIHALLLLSTEPS